VKPYKLFTGFEKLYMIKLTTKFFLQLKYCTVENEKLKLKKNNIYYYQVQGQLHITKRKLCFFIVYSPQWISVEEISYDDNFWTSNMEDKLQS